MYLYANMIIGRGGEGVVLRKPMSMYEHGKSNAVLKFKVQCALLHCNYITVLAQPILVGYDRYRGSSSIYI